MQEIEKRISIDPAWLPAVVDPKNFKFTFKWHPGERRALRRRKQVPVSEWCEQHRVVTMSSMPGKWKNETTPYLAGIMDASFFSSVQTIIVCAAPQTGKSEAVNNCIGYCVDRRPGSVLYVYPDEQTARENSKDRIWAMIESSRRLKSYVTGLDDDTSFYRINLQHMQIYMGWASSAARLGNKPLPYVVFDEIDKYPPTAGKREASPIALGEKRTRTFRFMRKIWKISTPTVEQGPIWVALTTEAQVIFDYWVRCPQCAASQLMTFDEEHFKFPKDERDPEKIEQLDLAWYECNACRAHWNDELRNQAVRRGEWRSRDKKLSLLTYLRSYKPKKIGFHIPSWLSYFVGLSEVAARFLRGTKDRIALRDFKNADCAEPWKYFEAERDEQIILNLRDDRPRGLMPAGGVVAGLTAGVDTQADGFWYEIRAWGWGATEESWQIREGYLLDFESVARVLWSDEYLDADGVGYLMHMTVMDAMGGTQRRSAGVGTRTAEVYDFCRRHPGRIFAFKGEQRMNQPFAYSKIDVYPGTSKPIPGGLRLLRGNVTFYKNKLANKLAVAPADPGAWHYHSETGSDWAAQMVAEHLDEKGLWQCPDGKANHAWDCSVYNLIAADLIGLKFWKKKTDSREKEKQTQPANNAPAAAGTGWLPQAKPDWLKR